MSLLGAVASLPQAALSLINSHTKSRNLASNAATGVRAATTGSTGTTTGTTGTTATSTAAQATTDIGTTFLTLLTKELQNQDPTAPMDSTAMVGQMISLNQLDQLIAINQALTPTSTTTASSRAVQGATDSASTLAAKQALLASTLPSSAAGTASPFSTSAVLNAAAQSASNASALDLTSLNSMFGGK